jgi:hypothetical protein
MKANLLIQRKDKQRSNIKKGIVYMIKVFHRIFKNEHMK